MSPARRLAFSILQRTAAGGWASDLLAEGAAGLDSRDAGLATELVLGSLRRQAQLDFLIAHFSGRLPDRLDPPVLAALRLGIYQLRYMDRIPSHAAVGESVELVKEARKRSATGFVNAVLRKIPRDPVRWPDRPTELSQPAWLLDHWDRFFGSAVANRIATAFLQPPETYVRHPPLDAGLELEPAGIPGAYRLLRGRSSGLRIQDIGSQAIVPLLGLEPGQTFLDLCAAPGNKTAQALETPLRAVACDLYPQRLGHVKGCPRVALDAARPLPFRTKFDRILVDAPCSGTGTLGRNPEIRWKLQPSDLRDLHSRQVRILANAVTALGAGGRLVYSTCSLEPEENEQVIAQLPLGYTVESTLRRTPGLDPGDGFFAAVITSK